MLDLVQHRDYLTGERHGMRAAHFHLVPRDGPNPFLDIELFPLCPTQLAGTNEHMSKNSQGRAGEGMPVVVVDRAKWRTRLFRGRDRCAMSRLWSNQRST